MSKEDIIALTNFLQPFPPHVVETALWLREFIWDMFPGSNELIYDNYNALAVGFSPTEKAGDVFCSIAIYSNYVNFGFNRGMALEDPGGLLQGSGNLYRYITVKKKEDFPVSYVKKLLKEAYRNSLMSAKNTDERIKGRTIVKSISKRKKRPA